MEFCEECGASSVVHVRLWAEELADRVLPEWPLKLLPARLGAFLEAGLEKIFLWFRVCRYEKNFNEKEVLLRTLCFIREAKKGGWEFEALRSPFGLTGAFRMRRGKEAVRFRVLPLAAHANRRGWERMDDKNYAKKVFRAAGLPTAEGRAFWFHQTRTAREFARRLGFPLVVKPRSGSVARHVTANITSGEEFSRALEKALSYSPTFIVERHVEGFVHRATVIDGKVFCVKQIPANVVGDGVHSVEELVTVKNADPRRAESGNQDSLLHQIVVDETVEAFLLSQGRTLSDVPPKGETVFLRREPFLRLGGDLEEETNRMHPENEKLFRDVAERFGAKVVGIDFVAKDISTSWRNQECALLETNSVPCIEMHHFPTVGPPQNAARELVAVVQKYYSSRV